MQTVIGRKSRTCYGSGRAATWDVPDSYGMVHCSYCGQLARINEFTGVLAYHEMPGTFRE
jgi:hypothetical protein